MTVSVLLSKSDPVFFGIYDSFVCVLFCMRVHAVGKDWISRHPVSLLLVFSYLMCCHAVGKDRISGQIMYVLAVCM